ncbi:MAG: hypothetical protein FJ190_12735 [Gammaproteobacteria bacterium]|nr:hypothetical protein [Gammaproteobacteria bacterium]
MHGNSLYIGFCGVLYPARLLEQAGSATKEALIESPTKGIADIISGSNQEEPPLQVIEVSGAVKKE